MSRVMLLEIASPHAAPFARGRGFGYCKIREEIAVDIGIGSAHFFKDRFHKNAFRPDHKNDPSQIISPLMDLGYLAIKDSHVSYIERIRDRSRYARQGILFIELIISLRGI